MIKYNISYTNPHRHFIDFKMVIPKQDASIVIIQLPSWRPGRYELGNFAKNIRAFEASDLSGEKLKYLKLNKDRWEISNPNRREVVITYSYYANILDAGSSYLDEEQLYINPVNCFFYLPDFPEMNYELDFDLPKDYQFATGLTKSSINKYTAVDHQELFDSPLIASATLQHLQYEVKDVVFHIWIQGKHQINPQKLIDDHKAFTVKQVEAFGDIPCNEYHFLYQFPEYKTRHGVEHCNSTVITMGPGSLLHLPKKYDELLGISCHELYHTWNVKSIRPKEMMPYDFSKENYTELGYVAEGVTTYFGDQYLWRSKVFSEEKYFKIIETSINRYLQNYGRNNLSVAESSFDTWLDGYVRGIPWRKVSIYNEGLLIALICDLRIIHVTNAEKSLDDVMTEMYNRFGKFEKGYTELDFKSILEEISGVTFDDVFHELVHGTSDYVGFLENEFTHFGIDLKYRDSKKTYARDYGFFTDELRNIVLIEPDSPADKAGMWFEDQVISVNNGKITSNLQHSISKQPEGSLQIQVLRKSSYLDFNLRKDGSSHFRKVNLLKTDKINKVLIDKWFRG